MANDRVGAGAAEQEGAVKQLLDGGQSFLALDAAQSAIGQFPSSLKLKQYAARALLNLGATEEAKKILEPLCLSLDPADPHFLQMFDHFRAAAAHVVREPIGTAPSAEARAAFAELIETVGRSQGRISATRAADEETVGLLAKTYKEAWRQSGRLEDARRCRDLYLRAYRQTGGTWTLINAATMSWVVGRLETAAGHAEQSQQDAALARELAQAAVAACGRQLATVAPGERFWLLATQGEALLHLDRDAEAVVAYQQAVAQPHPDDWMLVSAAGQLRLLAQWGFPVPAAIFESLRLPTVVLFVGHMIDRPGRLPPRFPPELEREVRERIEACLTDLDAKIGYSMAACGSDLLFIEAMQEREVESNIVLPFEADDFITTSVGFAGPQWIRRFRRALKLAGSHVTYATTERYLGTSSLFGYANQILHGLAHQRARSVGSEPYLVAVYDEESPALEGGTADVIKRWPDAARVRRIKLPEVSPQRVISTPAPAPQPAPALPPPPPREASRVVRSMLFADVVGFSTLQEDHVPYYMYVFLNAVAKQLRQLPVQPLMINTWGDAIFAVTEHALPLADYALALRRVVCTTDWRKLGLPAAMSVRIALHAGPVFAGTDAITDRPNFFGSHVNRTARIEPVTVPGQVYASQQFVALLTAEQRGAAEPAGGWPFTCEYLGRMNLAKNFGVIPVYSVRSHDRA